MRGGDELWRSLSFFSPRDQVGLGRRCTTRNPCFHGKLEVLYLRKGPVLRSHTKIQKSPIPTGIRTHDLLITSPELYCCASNLKMNYAAPPWWSSCRGGWLAIADLVKGVKQNSWRQVTESNWDLQKVFSRLRNFQFWEAGFEFKVSRESLNGTIITNGKRPFKQLEPESAQHNTTVKFLSN